MSLIVEHSTPLNNPLTRHAREVKPFRCYKGSLRWFTATFSAHYPKGSIEHVPASVPGAREMWVGRDDSKLGAEPGKGRVVALYRPQDPIPGVNQEFQMIPSAELGHNTDIMDLIAVLHTENPDTLKPGGELYEVILSHRMGSTQTDAPKPRPNPDAKKPTIEMRK
ncbi:hypothetical protein Peetri_00164 [Pseudomonas phage vB_PpuM-Peetri]